MSDIKKKYIDRYGESYGMTKYVDECQRQGIDPVTGRKLKEGLSDE
jgi:hypothetical protein